jgi:hypothetical protein
MPVRLVRLLEFAGVFVVWIGIALRQQKQQKRQAVFMRLAAQ